MTIAYHHHMGTIIQTEPEIDRLMALTGDSLTLLLDTGHATFAGADAVALAGRHRHRITHVHCKDVRPTVMAAALGANLSFLDAVVGGVFAVPGDGGVNFPAVLTALPGYDGWLVVEAEQDPQKAPPFLHASRGFANLSAYARHAGLH
jgi:inosose dehydratase